VPTPIIWREITTVFKGRVVRGSYAVEDGTVKVRTGHGEKAAHIRGTNRELGSWASIARVASGRKSIDHKRAAPVASREPQKHFARVT
jgi:hypothetical protein